MGLCVGSSLIGNNSYNVNSLKIRTLFTDICTVSWTVIHSLNVYIIDSVYQWFSKYGPWTSLKVHKTLHEVKTSVIVTLSYLLPFSFSFWYDFSWSYMVWDIATDWIQKQMKIQLYSIKANIKEICKNVKLRVLFTIFFCFRKCIFQKNYVKYIMSLLMFKWIKKYIF